MDMPTKESVTYDPYAPAEMAIKVSQVGVKKALQPTLTLLVLGALAGAFIAFGAMFYTMVVTDSTLGLGPTKLVGGVAFSLGLILVVIGGAELFTGNNLIVMAWAEGRIQLSQLLRNWGLVFVGNAIGAMVIALTVIAAGTFSSGPAAETAKDIAASKMTLPLTEAFVRGILCNALVCLAVWLTFASHRVSGKIIAMVFPVSAFVALGFEHCVANLYLIPLGLWMSEAPFPVIDFGLNLLVVTVGNVIGGAGFVAATYAVVYLRPK